MTTHSENEALVETECCGRVSLSELVVSGFFGPVGLKCTGISFFRRLPLRETNEIQLLNILLVDEGQWEIEK